jgi:S1-C subfamily serine protease
MAHREWRAAGLFALFIILVIGITACNQSSSPGQASATVYVPPSAQDLQQTVINVIDTVQPSVVQVTGQSSQGGSIGSGEILNTSGYIVSNDHVVSGFSNLSVQLSNGKQYSASLVGAAPQEDLAVLRIQASGLRPINVANSDKVQVGQFAIALGSPLGLEQSATLGIVSALDRSAGEGSSGTAAQLIGLIQTSAPINPGNSGGALVDLHGNLIGVPTLAAANPENGAAANGIGFAIPSNRMVFVLPVQSGVLVAGFSNDAGKSPAQQAGIKNGDIIVDVNGQPVASSSGLSSILLPMAPGTKVRITVVRGTSRPTVTVTLGERPAS